MKISILDFFKKYKQMWVLLYFFIYMPWFTYLEETVTTNTKFIEVHSFVDDMIPFVEYFVIPYVIWFAYIAIAVVYFLFFTSKTDFYKLTAFLFIGMTICLIIYTFFPNGQMLRPEVFPRDNIFTDMVKRIYSNDTPTNVCPSIHCFNSIGVTIAIFTCDKFRDKKFVKAASFVLTLLIMMSTLFIKQHSFVDMLGAIILSAVLYILIYRPAYAKISATDIILSTK